MKEKSSCFMWGCETELHFQGIFGTLVHRNWHRNGVFELVSPLSSFDNTWCDVPAKRYELFMFVAFSMESENTTVTDGRTFCTRNSLSGRNSMNTCEWHFLFLCISASSQKL